MPIEMTRGFLLASRSSAARIASLAVAEPPGELMRATTARTSSSVSSSSIALTVGPEASMSGISRSPSRIWPSRCSTASAGLLARRSCAPPMILAISSKKESCFGLAFWGATQVTSWPISFATLSRDVPKGTTSSTSLACCAAVGVNKRSDWTFRNCSRLSLRPAPI